MHVYHIGVDLIQGWNKKVPNVSQEGYGSTTVLPEQGIYLAAPLYRHIHQALANMKSINLFGVQQICWNSITLGQALAVIPSIDSEAVQQRLDHV
ncbi:exocyst complex component SEC8 [Gossypium raimondii]|uniref:exocyst complex component SEC8 n=1 Tax=Gossypium raimondii TaxID=29730 RepID=UPI00227A6AE2|nr:exocyst complex component SEC8 [Gossypium raimondii]